MAEPDRSPAAEPDTRAASLWPDTERLPDAARSSLVDASRFDPLYESRARERWRVARQFDLCRPALGLRILVFAQVAVVLPSLPLALGVADALVRATVLAFAALAGGLLWLSATCALRARLARLPAPWREAAPVALGGAAGACGWALALAFGSAPAGPWAASAAALCGGALAAAVWRWLGMRARAAQPVEVGARLAQLQSRVRPGFLFDALGAAQALVQVDPRKAEGVLEDLSQLLRVALADTSTAATLDEEIDLVQRYLAIEQLRFGDRLELAWDLDPAASAALVPPLVLLPLVENAVRRGVEPAPRRGRIRVRTRAWRGKAEVGVSYALPSDEPAEPDSAHGLAEVAERLRLLHDVSASVETGVEDGLVHARLVVPL